jgi:hypothetical protein
LVVPTVLLGLFFVYPYLNVAPSRRYAHRRFDLSLMSVFCWAMFFLSYMGTPKWGVDTAGDQEIAQSLAPMEGVGPVRSLSFDSYVNGVYCTSDLDNDHQLPLVQWGATSGPVPLLPDTAQPVMCQAVPESMHGLMDRYVYLMERWGENLPNAVGILTVSDDQPDLKRVDIKIIWNTAEVNEAGRPVYDENGELKILMVESTYDENGNQQMGADGLPVTFLVPSVQSSGKTVYVSRWSDYQGGGH